MKDYKTLLNKQIIPPFPLAITPAVLAKMRVTTKIIMMAENNEEKTYIKQ